MGYSFVQSKAASNAASATTIAVTTDANVTAGSVIWLVATGQKYTFTPSDTLGLTWTDMGSSQEAVIDAKLQHWYAKVTSSGAITITVTYSTTSSNRGVYALELGGLDATTPNDGSAEVTDAGTNPTANQNITPTVQPAVMMSFGYSLQGSTSPAFTIGSGMTLKEDAWVLDGRGLVQYKYVTSTSQQTANCVNTGLDRNVGLAAMFTESTATLEQVRFRWGNDDGSESAHGWAASENANLTAANNQTKLIRCQVQAAGDPSAIAYTLRSQKNGAGGYVAVPVGASTSPALTFGAAGTIAYSSSGGTTVAPTYPTGITTNSALVLVVGQKPSSANGGTCSTPAGWTLQAEISGANDGNTGGYTTTLGVDTGNTNLYVYTKDTVTGSESGTLSVTVGTNNVCWANIYRVQSSDTCTWSYAAATGKDTSAGNVSIATGSMAIAAGDYIIGAMVIPTDVSTPTQFSAQALSQSGTTFGTVTEIQEPDSGTGNDIGGFLIEAPVSSGSGSGAVTMTATAGGTTTNVRGPGAVIRIRATAISNECYIATSANITAGGEATTGRLTAGTGSFVTGRRWDDENGTDTIDITTDNYTEVEWAVALSSAPATNDYFDFRVYKGAAAMNTYTVTPRWTVGTGVAASTPTRLFGPRIPMAILAQ